MVCSGSLYADQAGYSRLFLWNLNLQRLLKSDWESSCSIGNEESLKDFENDRDWVKEHFGVIIWQECVQGGLDQAKVWSRVDVDSNVDRVPRGSGPARENSTGGKEMLEAAREAGGTRQ